MRKPAKINVSSHDFWELGEGQYFHYDHVTFNPSENMLFLSPHKLTHFMLRWVKKGEGNITIDHITYEIKPNMIFIGNPDQVRWFNVEKSSPFETYFITFKKELFALMNIQGGVESMMNNLGKKPFFEVDGAYRDFLEDTFKLLISVPKENSLHFSKIITSLIQTIIISIDDYNSLHQDVKSSGQQGYLNIYRQFIESLNENYKKYHFTSDYAELLYIPLKRLNRACKSVTNKTAGQIIADRIDFEAKRLLYYSTNTVKEISYELGYNHPTYFMKLFNDRNGISPNGFRKSIVSQT